MAEDSASRVSSDPHAGLRIVHSGPPPEKAGAVLLLLHGRGASAEDILALYQPIAHPLVAALAPQAAGGTWYPHSFLAPLDSNEPFLSSALRQLDMLIMQLSSRGIDSRRLALLGFSQGACLALEFAARRPRRYGALIALTGGLIGPPGAKRSYRGSLDGTPVFLGTSDPDPHVPFGRVRETEEVLRRMDGEVTLQRYQGMPHGVNEDELRICSKLLAALTG